MCSLQPPCGAQTAVVPLMAPKPCMGCGQLLLKHKVTNMRTTADHSPIHGFEAKPTYMASKWSAVVARTKRTTAVVLVLERV